MEEAFGPNRITLPPNGVKGPIILAPYKILPRILVGILINLIILFKKGFHPNSLIGNKVPLSLALFPELINPFGNPNPS